MTAFLDLYARHKAYVRRFLAKRAPQAELDDLEQETWLQVARSLHQFRGESDLGTWLCAVAKRVALTQGRRLRSRPELEYREETGELPCELEPDWGVTRDRVDALQRALLSLGPVKADTLVGYVVGGRDSVALARSMGTCPRTVLTRLHYARKGLAKAMREEPALASWVPPAPTAPEGER